MDHFIVDHVIEVADSEGDYSSQDKMNSKRRTREIQYEGDPNFALPLMYVANMYETLVNDVNIRLASLNGIREKTIGVALEAAGGLYRRLAKKFPKKGKNIFPSTLVFNIAYVFKIAYNQNFTDMAFEKDKKKAIFLLKVKQIQACM